MAYATDSDVAKVNGDVFTAGAEDLSAIHTEATRVIDRLLDTGWYRTEAYERGVDWRETPFDADLMLNASTQLKQAAVFKFIALAAERFDNYQEGSKWALMREHFEERFADEMASVLAGGIDYDWDSSGTVDDDEKFFPTKTRLVRM